MTAAPARVPPAPAARRRLGAAAMAACLPFAAAASEASHAAAPAALAAVYAAMAIEGDVAYGEYLANECVGCHQLSGHVDGIPAIVGWPREEFVRTLFDYKFEHRRHEGMRSVTSRLGAEEVAALAAYFGAVAPR